MFHQTPVKLMILCLFSFVIIVSIVVYSIPYNMAAYYWQVIRTHRLPWPHGLHKEYDIRHLSDGRCYTAGGCH